MAAIGCHALTSFSTCIARFLGAEFMGRSLAMCRPSSLSGDLTLLESVHRRKSGIFCSIFHRGSFSKLQRPNWLDYAKMPRGNVTIRAISVFSGFWTLDLRRRQDVYHPHPLELRHSLRSNPSGGAWRSRYESCKIDDSSVKTRENRLF